MHYRVYPFTVLAPYLGISVNILGWRVPETHICPIGSLGTVNTLPANQDISHSSLSSPSMAGGAILQGAT